MNPIGTFPRFPIKQVIVYKGHEKHFPDCGTNWKAVKARLSSEDHRMRFVLNAILLPLENFEWE